MSIHENPGDTNEGSAGNAGTVEPGTAAAENPAAAAKPLRTTRWIGVTIAVVLFALPLFYLAAHHAGRPQVVRAGSPAQAASGADIVSLEQLARSTPTVANRINLSLAYINGGAAGRAIPVLLGVVAQDKRSVVAWNDLCVAHTLQQDYATAIDECNQALLIDPGYQLARNNLQWASGEKAKTLEAIAAAKRSGAPRDAAFYLAEGLNELHAGDYDEAIVSWRQALQTDPRNATVANNIGTAYMMKKQPRMAIDWYEKALAMDPSMQLAKNNLAWAHSEQAK